MRFLHTGDWHVGKTLRGRPREDEHQAVLAEIARLAAERQVDAVLVAGDLFDSSAPSPAAEKLVYRTLMELAGAGAHVVIIAGNHDNPRRLDAVRPLLGLTRVIALHQPCRPADGGVVTVRGRSGERARIALLPFLSQRRIVRAEALMRGDAAEHAASYAQRTASIVRALCEGAGQETVNLLLAHATVLGAEAVGSERHVHTVMEYRVPSTAFPPELHYVALGHLHRAQRIDGACPIAYCGSPLQLDFGEAGEDKSVYVIEARPGTPAEVEQVPLREGRRLMRVRGRLEELEARAEAGEFGEDYLSVSLDEKARAGLADDVRRLLPQAIDVRLARREEGDGPGRDGAAGERIGRSPRELFAEYLAAREVDDPDVEKLFAELLEEMDAAAAA